MAPRNARFAARQGAHRPGRPFPRRTAGFLLLVIITIILAMAILIFALSSHKSGAIEQLARTVDQNRLAILAQSGNNEMVAFIKDNANNLGSTYVFNKFREVFTAATPPALPKTIRLYPQGTSSEYCPQETQKIAQDAGYNIRIVSKADLVLFGASEVDDMRAWQGYLEVVSRASHADRPDNMVEIKERRDVKLVDLRHFFDQYVFFCKNYMPDYNHPRKRLILKGVKTPSFAKGCYSRAYFGNRCYPDNKEFPDGEGRLWFDASYNEQKDLLGPLVKVGNRVSFPTSPEDYLYWANVATFSFIKGPLDTPDFYRVEAAKHVFETIVNAAAERKWPVTKFDRGKALWEKARTSMGSNINDKSAAYKICEDFTGNDIANATARNYGACAGFRQVVKTCFEKWRVQWGYTDAESVWKVKERDLSALPQPKEWVKNLQYGGLASETYEIDGQKMGAYFYEYLKDASGDLPNKERCRVGIMAQVFGTPSDRRPLLIEGRAYLRFFKIAFLDDFTTDFETLTDLKAPEFAGTTVVFPPVPVDFRRPEPATADNKTFQNTDLGNNLLTHAKTETREPADRSYLAPYLEKYLMSRDISTIPLNCLLGTSMQIPAPGGETSYDPWSGVINNPCAEFNPKSGDKYYRCIDWTMLSRDYQTGADFVADRVQDDGSKKVLYLDGVMLIRKGPLDLSQVSRFVGKGLLFVGEGDCYLGTLKKAAAGSFGENHLRIYLHGGDFEIRSSTSDVEIEASLTALTYKGKNPPNPGAAENQGNLYCNGKNVTIFGNLILDYLQLEWGSRGLPIDGTLTVEHDPLIFNPESPTTSGGPKQDPYRVSIGEVRTLYSMNAGERSF
ncbi:MAG: hypothetical protein GX442_03075 [Candidatus Riflebacteria bacterium]|nr:hypothetical protein [Candidatus Riflebacteria bacterium]